MQKLKLHFDFGWHRYKEDAAGMRERLLGFRPHVYIMEDISLPNPTRSEPERCLFEQSISGTNRAVEMARKNRGDMRSTLLNLSNNCRIKRDREMGGFKKEEFSIILEAYRLVVFFLETHGRTQEVNERTAETEALENNAIRTAYTLAFPNALELLKQSLCLATEMYRFREDNIIANLPLLQDSLLSHFERFRSLDVIKVFVRYGIVHTRIFDAALSLGMDASAHYVPEEDYFENGLIRKRIVQPDFMPDEADLMRVLLICSIMTGVLHAGRVLASNRTLDIEPSIGWANKLTNQYVNGRTNEELTRLIVAVNGSKFTEAASLIGALVLTERGFGSQLQNPSSSSL